MSEFKVGDRVVLIKIDEGKTGVVESIDPPGTSWPINLRMDHLDAGEETWPVDPEEIAHVSQG